MPHHDTHGINHNDTHSDTHNGTHSDTHHDAQGNTHSDTRSDLVVGVACGEQAEQCAVQQQVREAVLRCWDGQVLLSLGMP